jgi:hypothetical protein
VLRSGDPVEQEKRIKYPDLVANAMMLHTVVDMTNVLRALQQEGVSVTPEVVSHLSLYLTEHIKDSGSMCLIWTLSRNLCSQITLCHRDIGGYDRFSHVS